MKFKKNMTSTFRNSCVLYFIRGGSSAKNRYCRIINNRLVKISLFINRIKRLDLISSYSSFQNITQINSVFMNNWVKNSSWFFELLIRT